MSKPEFITNQDGNTLLAALKAAIPDAPPVAAPGAAEAPAALTEISIATAFMSPAGFGQYIRDDIAKWTKVAKERGIQLDK